MVLVGKTTFLSYISEEVKAFKKNVAIEVTEWNLGKFKEEMNLEEFIEGLIVCGM